MDNGQESYLLNLTPNPTSGVVEIMRLSTYQIMVCKNNPKKGRVYSFSRVRSGCSSHLLDWSSRKNVEK